MEDRKTINPVVVIAIGTIILIVVFILVFFSKYGSTREKENVNSNSTSTPTEYIEDSSKNDLTDTTKETEKIINPTIEIKRIQKFLSYRIEDYIINQNILKTPENRLEFIEYLLMVGGNVKSTTDIDMQPSAYTSRNDFESKYNEIFGTNYSIPSEINNLVNDCTFYSSLNGTNTVCWNNAWGSPSPLSFTLTDKKQTESEIIYKGSFEKVEGRERLLSGTYEIIYTIQQDKKYLKSIILKKN